MSQAIEDTGTHALSCNQVQLGVDPGEHPAIFADVASSVPGEITKRLEYQADLVEMVGDGVGARVHPDLKPGALTLQPLRPFSPSQMYVAVRTSVTGMASYRSAKLLELSLGVWIESGLAAAQVITV